jgi:hypothetical protein
LNQGKRGVDENNVRSKEYQECSQLRLMEKHVWNKVRVRKENKKIKLNK